MDLDKVNMEAVGKKTGTIPAFERMKLRIFLINFSLSTFDLYPVVQI